VYLSRLREKGGHAVEESQTSEQRKKKKQQRFEERESGVPGRLDRKLLPASAGLPYLNKTKKTSLRSCPQSEEDREKRRKKKKKAGVPVNDKCHLRTNNLFQGGEGTISPQKGRNGREGDSKPGGTAYEGEPGVVGRVEFSKGGKLARSTKKLKQGGKK